MLRELARPAHSDSSSSVVLSAYDIISARCLRVPRECWPSVADKPDTDGIPDDKLFLSYVCSTLQSIPHASSNHKIDAVGRYEVCVRNPAR